MKKRFFTSFFCIVLSAFIALSTLTTVLAYSSDNDPIVTLSYLNEVVLPMLREEFSKNNSSESVENPTDNLDEQLDENKNVSDDTSDNLDSTSDTPTDSTLENTDNNSENGTQESTNGPANDKTAQDNQDNSMENINDNAAKIGTYELLELTAGQTVLCDSAVEIIVRPGSLVTVVSPFEAQGIADITNGNELLNNVEIPINAYCIIPRGKDGRGFYVHSENAYVMIRGEYTIG